MKSEIKFIDKPWVFTMEPFGYINMNVAIRLLIQNNFHISLKYLPKALYSIVVSTLLTPFRIVETLLSDKKIKNTIIDKPPIFIIGHWRSGTTYLHNVMSQNKNLGYFTTLHSVSASMFLNFEKLLKPIVNGSLPVKRPFDDVDLNSEVPQEEEYGVSCFTPISLIGGWMFPKHMEHYNRFACLQGVKKEQIESFKKAFLYVLKKETLYRKGKQLLTKNPANLGRIKLLLEMFPDAKFIHIVRNPYPVHQSMMKLMSILIPLYALNNLPTIEKTEKIMMDLYSEIYRKYLNERKLIPPGNHTEVKYEDFIKNPLNETKRIFSDLGLSGFKEYEQAFKDYIKTQDTIKIDSYDFKDKLKEKIYKEWGFTFEEFGYEK